MLTGPWMVTSRDVTVLSTWTGSHTLPVKSSLIARVTCTHCSVHHSLEIIVKRADFRFMNAQLTKLTLKHLKTTRYNIYIFCLLYLRPVAQNRWSDDDAVDLYAGGADFESRKCHRR